MFQNPLELSVFFIEQLWSAYISYVIAFRNDLVLTQSPATLSVILKDVVAIKCRAYENISTSLL